MGDDEELGRIKEILPDDIGCRSEWRQGVEEGIGHPDSKGGVFLSESLSGGNRRDTGHGGRCSSRVDEDILVVTPFGRGRQEVADEFAEAELEQADEEGAC